MNKSNLSPLEKSVLKEFKAENTSLRIVTNVLMETNFLNFPHASANLNLFEAKL